VIGIIPATFVFATFGAGLGDLLAGNGEITLGHVLSPLILTALAGLALARPAARPPPPLASPAESQGGANHRGTK